MTPFYNMAETLGNSIFTATDVFVNPITKQKFFLDPSFSRADLEYRLPIPRSIRLSIGKKDKLFRRHLEMLMDGSDGNTLFALTYIWKVVDNGHAKNVVGDGKPSLAYHRSVVLDIIEERKDFLKSAFCYLLPPGK